VLLAGVAVEKLLPAKFTKIKSHSDALQTTFSTLLDIFYPPNFRCFDKNGVFQQPQAITLTENCPTPVRVEKCFYEKVIKKSRPTWRPSLVVLPFLFFVVFAAFPQKILR
jgi:hypothetical protein